MKPPVKAPADQPSMVPPHNIEAEQACLGAVLICNQEIHKVAEAFTSPEPFYREAHNLIWAAMCRLRDRNEPIDLISCTNELRKMRRLEASGGPAYLDALINITQSSAHADQYARIVAERQFERGLIRAAHDIIAIAFADLPRDTKQQQSAYAIEQVLRGSSRHEAISMRAAMRELGAYLCSQQEKREKLKVKDQNLIGLDTGFRVLNLLTGGWMLGEMSLIVGRPGMGKTAFGEYEAVTIAESGLVYFNAADCPRRKLARRAVARQLGTAIRDVIDPEQAYRASVAAQEVMDRIYVDEERGITARRMITKAQQFAMKHQHEGLELVCLIVDYLSLASETSDWKDVGQASRTFANFAGDTGRHVMALQQGHRRIDDRPVPDRIPRMSDIKESGQIEQDAKVIIGLYRRGAYDTSYDPTKAEAWIIKQNDGPSGKCVPLVFRPSTASFEDPPLPAPPAAEPPPPDPHPELFDHPPPAPPAPDEKTLIDSMI